MNHLHLMDEETEVQEAVTCLQAPGLAGIVMNLTYTPLEDSFHFLLLTPQVDTGSTPVLRSLGTPVFFCCSCGTNSPNTQRLDTAVIIVSPVPGAD